ncbi:hypothetical protein D3C72_908100 [compost metagenome]
MSSPACAASRRSAWPAGTAPKTVTLIARSCALRVVSPPISGQPWAAASAWKPSAKAASQGSSRRGRARPSTQPMGRAPMAARSDRFTASDLWPKARGSTSEKKWRPSSNRSVLVATCSPAGTGKSAQSSPTPSKPAGAARVK